MSDKKLKAWVAAGLIDTQAADRIRVWEEANSKPLGLWALIGLGGLAIGLGLISVVAANWDEIPGTVRLAVHFAMMIATGGWVWWQRQRLAASARWFDDAALFIFGMLGLTFFGHIGQVYQTSAPLWQAFLAWLVLFSPIVLWQGRGWLVAAGWSAALYFTAGNFLEWFFDASNPANWIIFGTLFSLPAIVMAAASAVRGWVGNVEFWPDFWRRIEQIGMAVLMFGISSASATVSFGTSGSGTSETMKFAVVMLLWLAAAAAIIRASRPNQSGRATAMILVVAGLLVMIGATFKIDSLFFAILFMVLWGSIAFAALSAGWRMVFQVAVAAVALRLIALSFEFGDLLSSGFGLILAGLFTLGVAWVAVKISKRFAPVEGEVAA